MDLDAAEYCRQLEDYLCRRNGGHRVRIVGPAFEQVCSWAARGVPLKVAQRGIDRYCERYEAKQSRRRPVQIQFCEPDVLDVFDEWRRAIGIPAAATVPQEEGANAEADEGARRHGTLPAHLERVIARLTSLRAGADRSLDAVLDAIVRELDGARAGAKGLRGEARAAFVERLRVLDRTLLDAARQQCDAAALAQLGEEADRELAPFRDRMAADVYASARAAAIDRLIRDRRRLPIITFD